MINKRKNFFKVVIGIVCIIMLGVVIKNVAIDTNNKKQTIDEDVENWNRVNEDYLIQKNRTSQLLNEESKAEIEGKLGEFEKSFDEKLYQNCIDIVTEIEKLIDKSITIDKEELHNDLLVVDEFIKTITLSKEKEEVINKEKIEINNLITNNKIQEAKNKIEDLLAKLEEEKKTNEDKELENKEEEEEEEEEKEKEQEQEEVDKEEVKEELDTSTSEPKPSYMVSDMKKDMWTKEEVNIRKEPGANYEKIGHFKQNTKVSVIGKVSNGWYKVNSDFGVGFVSGNYLSDEKIVIPETTTPPVVEEENWVANLKVAQNNNQLIIVSAEGTSATVSMHTKDANNKWIENYSVNGFVGKNGVGNSYEGSGMSPRGVHSLPMAFGIKSNPGTALSYTKVDDSHYWVDDINSKYYNKFVSTNDVVKDWNSAEHIIGYGAVYNYCISIGYNLDAVPGKGSAFFLHGSKGRPTAGCVAIPESYMIKTLNLIKPGCKIVIDNKANIKNY